MRRRPTSVDPERIHEVARTLAFERGLHAITIPALAEALGVPPKLVAKVEPSADAVVVAVFQSVVAGELAEAKRLVLAHPQPLRQLRALLDYLGESSETDLVDAVWAEAWSLCRRLPPLAAVVRNEERSWVGFVSAVVQRGVRSGDFLPADADEVAHTLLAVIDGVNMWTLAGYRDDVDRKRLLASVAERQLGVALSDRETAGTA